MSWWGCLYSGINTMSTQSGITASPELVDAFNKLSSPALVITLSEDATQLVEDESFAQPSASSTPAVLESLHDHFSASFPEPGYAVFAKSDGLLSDIVFLSFIPDLAPIKKKLLFASTKNTLLQQFGSKIAKHYTLALTELEELTHEAFLSATLAAEDKSLWTEKERDLDKLNALETLTLSQSTQLPSMHKDTSLFFQIDSSLAAVLKGDLTHKLVVMNIDTNSEVLVLTADVGDVQVLNLVESAQRAVDGSHAEPTPLYALFGYAPQKAAFIYLCPSGCKVKARMVYAANKQGLILHLKNDFFTSGQLQQVLEVGDLDELDTSRLEEQKVQAPSASSSLKFSKPRGPRRR